MDRKRGQKKGLNLRCGRDFLAPTPSVRQPLFETSDQCRGRKKHINVFNINFLAPPQKNIVGPQKKVDVPHFLGKNAKKASQTGHFRPPLRYFTSGLPWEPLSLRNLKLFVTALLGSEQGVFWKRGLFRKIHFLEVLEILGDCAKERRIRPFSRDSRDSREFRDSRYSRDSSSEKDPFVIVHGKYCGASVQRLQSFSEVLLCSGAIREWMIRDLSPPTFWTLDFRVFCHLQSKCGRKCSDFRSFF